jgi:hypothetical protein
MKLTQDLLHIYFSYDPAGYLVWKHPTCNNFSREGRRVGCTHPITGYTNCNFFHRTYRVHRLIFLYHFGYLPPIIDHINRVRDDNRIENLREATYSQNNVNSRIPSNNSSGVVGVCYCLPSGRRKSPYWLAFITLRGKKYSKPFQNEEEAINWRIFMEHRLFAEFSPLVTTSINN